MNEINELKADATLEEQCNYFKEQAVNFALNSLALSNKYDHDVALLMFMVAEYIPFFENMMIDLGMQDVLDKFKKERSLKK